MAFEGNTHGVKLSFAVLPVEEPGYGDVPLNQSVVQPGLQYRVVSAYQFENDRDGVWPTPPICNVPPIGICQNSPRLYWNWNADTRTYTSVNSEEAEVIIVGVSKAIIGFDTYNDDNDGTNIQVGEKVRVAFNSGDYNEVGFITADRTGTYSVNHVGVALESGVVGDVIAVAVNCA